MTLHLSGTVGTIDGKRVVTCSVSASVMVPRGAVRRVVNVCGLDAVRASAADVGGGADYDAQYRGGGGGLLASASASASALALALPALPLPAGARWAWLGVSAAEWDELAAAGDAVGKALALRVIQQGGDEILGELRSGAQPRPPTYGAAELPLDR